MEWPGELWRRLLFGFRRRQFDRDLEEEMRFHLDMKAREAGLAAARKVFGNATLFQEQSREAWGWMALEQLFQDLRYALRTMRGSPGFTSIVILTLALGIGVNTAIFSFVDRLLLRPLPFPQSERLATLYFRAPRYSTAYSSLSYPSYVYYRDHNSVMAGLAAYSDIQVNMRFGEDMETVPGEIVSANYFSVLGVAPVLGRTFLAEEDAVPGRNAVVMLAAEFWRRRFGGDPAIIGRQVAINGVSFTVVGIVPPGFGGLQVDRTARPILWVPAMMYPVADLFANEMDLQHLWGDDWLSATGRLKPGVTFAQAEANIAQLTERLRPIWRAEKLDEKDKLNSLLTPANESRFPPESRGTVTRFLAMLMAVVALVLLIACSNVASLMLARAVKRQREIGMRLALGAGRARLARQLLTEGLLLSFAGGAAGLAIALLTARSLAGFQPFGLPLMLATGIDGRVLAFAFGLSVLTGVLFGLIPLRQVSPIELAHALKSEGPRHGRRRFGARNLLVVAQVALSLILLAGAGLFVRTLRNAQAADITRNPENVLLLSLDLTVRKYDAVRGQRFYDALLDRLHALPGVRSAAYVLVVPFGGRRGGTNIVPRPGDTPVQVDFNSVSAEYFQTVGIPLVRGRAFDANDREGAAGVVVVNEQMARRFWPGEDPIGKQIGLEQPKRLAEIVGVVRDGRFRGYRAQVNPSFYVPLAQRHIPRMNLEVRTAGDPARLVAAVRHEIQSLDRDLLVPEFQTLRSFRDAGLGQERLSAALLSGLGILAALIAAIGIYGVLAFAVAQRTREIGIRMALGAASRQVMRSVLADALALVGAGVAIGCVAALALVRFISSLLYGVSSTDPAVYAGTAGILIAVGALASYPPARRASRVDPMVALRCE
jgi:predicted permease